MKTTATRSHHGLLADGEVRHYSSWETPSLPRLDMSRHDLSNYLIFRRQKRYAPQVRGRRGLRLLLDALYHWQ